MNTGAFLATLLLIVAVELPDKTVVATLVLASRYRPLPVLAGASAAFAVQCVLAVAAGQLLTLLPREVVLGVVAALFAVGAVLLLREALGSGHEETVAAGAATGAWRIALTSFGVLFAAEWGDASQIATAALAARYDAPVEVFLGALLGLVTVSAIAVALGRAALRVVPLRWIQLGAAVLFACFAVLAVVELI